jgi:uncharacterized protein
VGFEWDDDNISHIARHGVRPEEAEEAFLDRHARPIPAESTPTERRFGRLGATEDGRILILYFTRRRGAIRIFNARSADLAERRRYRRH